MRSLQPALGTCHIGLNFGVDAAISWLDDDTLCIAHGCYVSWCRVPDFREETRLALPAHVRAIDVLEDGTVLACDEADGVHFLSRNGVQRSFIVEGAMFGRATPSTFALVRTAPDEEHGFNYEYVEGFDALTGESRGVFGGASMLDRALTLPINIAPDLSSAMGLEWWGRSVRTSDGGKHKLERDRSETAAAAFVDRGDVLFATNEGVLHRVRVEDGVEVARATLPQRDGVGLSIQRGQATVRFARRWIYVLDDDLSVVMEHDAKRNVQGALASPNRQRLLLAFSPDSVSPLKLQIVEPGKKPRRLEQVADEISAVAVREDALFLGRGSKGVMRLDSQSLLAKDIKVGRPVALASGPQHVAALGSALALVDAGNLEVVTSHKIRANPDGHFALALRGDVAVASSGGRVAVLSSEGLLHDRKLPSSCKVIAVASTPDGAAVLDNDGLLEGPDERSRELLKLSPEVWSCAVANHDGTWWAVDDGTRLSIIAPDGGLRELPSPDAVTALRFDPKGRRLAVGGVGVLQIVDLANDTAIVDVPVPGQCRSMAFSPSGDSLFVVLGTHLGGPFGDLVPGEIRAFATGDGGQLLRMLIGKTAALVIGPDGSCEALGDTARAQQLAVVVEDIQVAPLHIAEAGSALLERALR